MSSCVELTANCCFTCSGPDSFVFVNLVDHGAPGIFAFPEEYVRGTNAAVFCLM